MLRFQIPVLLHKFQKPELISEEEYHLYKSILNENPNIRITETIDKSKDYKYIDYILLGLPIGGTLTLLFSFVERLDGFIGFLAVISSLYFAIGGFGSIFLLAIGSFDERKSYRRFLIEYEDFSERLKKAIIRSENYYSLREIYESDIF